jgi:hypothetical protein
MTVPRVTKRNPIRAARTTTVTNPQRTTIMIIAPFPVERVALRVRSAHVLRAYFERIE